MMFERSIWRLNVLVLLVLTSTAAFLSPLPFQAIRHSGVSTQSLSPTSTSTTTGLFFSSKNWDAILDDEDDDDDDEDGPVVPFDMQYNERNIVRQNNHFMAIREAAGKELTNDLYCRNPKSNVFWFSGKIARVSDVSVEQAIARQWALIETHASNLRPIELYPAKGIMEIWSAPGDSEMQVVYNDPDLVLTKMEREVPGVATVKNILMGFQGEQYEGGEEGFRTTRLEDGRPANPEMKPPSAEDDDDDDADGDGQRSPTDEEMEQLKKALEGKDIDELYEEQQRREGEAFEV
jgi:hypothetical protein